MEVIALEIPDVRILRPPRFRDARGFFSETYSGKAFAAAGIDIAFVQDNHSLSTRRWTVRGLHFQVPPHAQDKLVRVVRGSVLDVAVDLRRGSPTYGKHVKTLLSAQEWNQVFIPRGFAHGYCTLEADTEVLYKVSDYYSPEHDKGILWTDPDLGIDWPVGAGEAVVSEKDRRLPVLKDLPEIFVCP